MSSHYELLEISSLASSDEIRAAYRTQAFRHYLNHAAAAGDDGDDARSDAAIDHLDALHEAHAVLSDPARRRAYDAALSARNYATEMIASSMENFHKAIEALELDHAELRSWRDLAPSLLNPRLPQPLRHTLTRFARYWGFRYTGPGRRTVQDEARQVVRQYETYYRERLWPE